MGFIVKQKKRGDSVHIYLAESHFVAGKGSRQSRTYLGVLSIDGTELFVGERHETLITEDVIKLLEKKGIAFHGKQANPPGRRIGDTNGKEIAPRINRKSIALCSSFEHGRLDLLKELVRQSHLEHCTFAAFGEDLALTILALAEYQVCEGAPLYLASEWCHETGQSLNLSSPTISRVLDALGKSEASINSFFQLWIKANNYPTSLVHDTTSISSYSETIDDLEWGYNRDHERLPQLNIAMVADRVTRVPIWYRVLPGSIPDVSTLKKTSDIVSSLGITRFTFFLDRGFFSKSNVIAMLNAKIDFILGVPCHLKHSQDIIKAHYNKLQETENLILYDGSRYRYTSLPYPVIFDDRHSENVSGHLFLDVDRRDSQVKKLETGIAEVYSKARDLVFSDDTSAKNWIDDNAGPLAKYLVVVESNKIYTVAMNSTTITKDSERCGLVLLIGGAHPSRPEQVLSDYRSRDVVEKVFDKLKNGVGFDRIRCSGNYNSSGRIFIAFIATILRSILESRLRKSGLLGKYSVDEALAVLKRIRSTTLPNGKLVSREIPAKCREILEACSTP